MKKLSTLYKTTGELNPENQWVLDGEGTATRKFSGVQCSIIEGELYKFSDAELVKCIRDNEEDKAYFQGYDNAPDKTDGNYVLIGPEVKGNPEKHPHHILIRHGAVKLKIEDYSYEGLRAYLNSRDFEGIVFSHEDGRICKISRKDLEKLPKTEEIPVREFTAEEEEAIQEAISESYNKGIVEIGLVEMPEELKELGKQFPKGKKGRKNRR